MQYIKMNYKGFEFDINPSSIKMELSKRVSKRVIPFKSTKIQEICFNPAKFKGSGCFYGKNARQQAHSLVRLFNDEGSAYLFSPDFPPTRAFFNDLSISFNAQKDAVEYTVEFVEDSLGKKDKYNFGFTYALYGENLFDIANRCDKRVEDLFDKNNFENLFSVKEGDKVWLN